MLVEWDSNSFTEYHCGFEKSMVRALSILIALLVSLQCVHAENERYAFVTMYYPGAHQSHSDMIAIRTLYKSFLAVKSKAEFLVISSPDISQKDKLVFNNDGIQLRTMSLQNAYKHYQIIPDYQKTKNLEFLWKLKDYKRVIFVDPYTIFTHNFDSLFDCSYLCLKDEQPLLYSNTMIVITPGHEETEMLFRNSINGKATIDQYSLYNHRGYYSTELYEISQAAPVFDLGDPENSDQLVRRFLNFVNFPVMMWYEKFNWNLYSCSKLDDAIPVFSINFQYTLGHKEMFLPTHWFSYRYVWVMNNYWLTFRQQINESFFFTHLYCLLQVILIILFSMLLIPVIGAAVSAIHETTKEFMKKVFFTSALLKLTVSVIILGIWYVSFSITPYYLYPEAGYFFFYLYYTMLSALFIFGFNRGTNMILGTKQSCKHSLFVLIVCHGLYALAYCTSLIEKIPWIYRVGLMFVQFFVELYSIYSQLSPLVSENKIMYTALPE